MNWSYCSFFLCVIDTIIVQKVFFKKNKDQHSKTTIKYIDEPPK